ncbi:TetR/AcrR family transcriptional regulator [Ideonella dechloratans]|uniref:TetR/AcrR family transcriptional regulator n=1 Tax=Ideonella dechloratans TaxID=36863 RepID=UPI0035AD9E94
MPPSLSSEQVLEARARIRAVAEQQFAERGIEQTSMRSIAQALGWTATALYRYYDSKEALLAATRAAALDRLSAALEAAQQGPGDVWDRSRAVGQAYVDFAFAEPAAYGLIFAYTQPQEDAYPDLAAANARSRRTMVAYVEDLVQAGQLEGDPELLGHVYWAAMHGAVVLQMSGKLVADGPGFDAIRREGARLITKGAQPASTRVRRR